MYGRPGTGKTQIALAMANTLGLPVVLARLDGLVSSFLGNTARNIATLFRFANRYRCILLLDEFDAIAKMRDDPQEVGEIKRVVNTILQNIDLRREQGITIAITNHEQLLDPAVWRRFQVRIHIPVPSFAERQLIILKYFPPVELTELQLKFIAWLSDGMTGADIEVMSQNVKRFLALNESQSILAALKHNTLTHAGRKDTPNLGSLLISEGRLATLLADSKDLGFRQKDIAVLLDTNQSKVNRLLRANHQKAA
jgi:SpoVK/Ycf46/Vps4 family AAA+-type ATPase